jgi:hypothetical protein
MEFIPLSIIMFRVTDQPQSGWLVFSAYGGKKQRHGSALIGAGVIGCKAPGLKTPKYGIAA